MADYRIFRSLETQLREQIVAHLGDVDDRLIVIEDYLGNAPSGGIVFRYKYDDALAGDPGAGHAGADSLVHANVTSVRISTLTDAGNDITTFLQNLNIGDSIGFFELLAPNNTAFFQLTAAGVDQTGYFSFAVTPGTGGTQAMPSADEVDIDLYLVGDPARLMPPGGVDNAVLKKQSAADYDVDWELIPHDELTGITTDQHHAKLHAHDGVDGSGQVAHDDTTGITPDNHHNQVHLLHGSDHSDVILDPLLDRHVLAVRVGGTDFAPEYRMNWRNTWGQQTYYRHDTVRDGPYTMVANKETTERAAPQNVGSPAWDMPDVPLWSNFANTSIVGSGHSYEFLETAYLQSIRVWPPSVGPDITYRLTTVRQGSVGQSELTTLTPGEWNIIGLDNILMAAGETLLVYLEAVNAGSSTQVTGGWTRGANDNALEPANQSWNQNVQRTVLRIDFDDLDTVDRQTELEGIAAGSTIQMVETAVNVNSITYRVVNPPVTGLTSVSYDVIVIDEGVNLPTVGQPTTMTADVPVPQSTDFVGIVNGWVGVEPVYADVTSFLAFDGVDQGADPDNQYGVSILVQRISISPDWDLLALSGGGGGGGGGGGDPFPEAPADGQTYGRDGLAQDWSPVYTKDESADLLLGEAWPTGLFDGGELNIVAGPNIEIIAGAGVVVDSYTDPLAIPTDVHLSWDTQDQLITTPAVAGTVAYFTMADGAVPGPLPNTNLGVLTEYSSPPTQAQIRDQIFIGYAIFNGATWGEVSSPIVVNNSAHTLSDYLRWVTGPTRIIDGGKITEAALLTLDQAAGVFWEQNRNWHVNKKDPNRESFSTKPNLMWRYVNRDMTSVSALTGTADPTLYDDGSPAPVPIGGASQACTVQRLYIDPRDNFWVLWGQNIYPTYLDAVANIGADTTNTEIPGFLQSSLLLGHIVAERVQTDWAPDMAEFVAPLDALGSGAGGGGGADTFLDLTDTPSGYAGHANKVTAVAGTEDALEFVTQIPEPAQSGLTYGRWWTGLAYEWASVALDADLDAHIADLNNPHQVTYAQLPDKPTIPTTYWTASGDQIVNANIGSVGIGGVPSGTPAFDYFLVTRDGPLGIKFERTGGNPSQVEFVFGSNRASTFMRGNSLHYWEQRSGGGGDYQIREWVDPDTEVAEALRISHTTRNVSIGENDVDTHRLAVLSGASDIMLLETTVGTCWLNFKDSATVTPPTIGAQGDAMTFGTAAAERMRITSAGNVGIGTSSPTGKLSFGNNLQDNIIHLYETGSVRYGFGIQNNEFRYYTYTGAAHVFGNMDSSLTFNEMVRIDSDNGRVGIRTNNPGYSLDINPGGNSAGSFNCERSGGANLAYIRMSLGGNNPKLMLSVHGNPPVEIATPGNSMTFDTAGAEAMRITSVQNVGIGTSNPLNKFVVSNAGAIGLEVDAQASLLRTLVFSRSGAVFSPWTLDANSFIFGTSPSGVVPTERMRITTAGNVGIGRSDPSVPLGFANTVAADGEASKIRLFDNGVVGGIYGWGVSNFNLNHVSGDKHTFWGNGVKLGGFDLALGTGSVYSNAGYLTNSNPSDFNLKEGIWDSPYGLDAINALRPVEFRWKVDNEKLHYGFIAQDVQSVIPEIVVDEDTHLGIRSEEIVPILVKAVQEQSAIIESLTQRIEELENG